MNKMIKDNIAEAINILVCPFFKDKFTFFPGQQFGNLKFKKIFKLFDLAAQFLGI